MVDVFNPKILDASIRDIASCLSDNQKVDLLLYAMKSLHFEGRSRTIIENAIQSCLQITTLAPENIAKARILRARARLASGSHFSAQEDLQAALLAEPDNPEAKALLHQRSVTVEKLLSPLPPNKERLSNEIWREICLHLPRRDLKALLFVPHAVSRVASHLLFRVLDLYFCGYGEADEGDSWSSRLSALHKDDECRHAQRSADILTRIITDPSFATAVRTLKIFAPRRDRDGSMAFQTGMLTNALPKLLNLRNVHISAGSESIVPVLRILQSTSPKLRGLSMHSPDGPADLSFLELRHLAQFSYTAYGGGLAQLHNIIAQNRGSLRIIILENLQPNPNWIFPANVVSIRNLTSIHFAGDFPVNSHAFADILTNGRQLESLTITCSTLECTGASASQQFRSMQHANALPFLRNFSFSVNAVGRRTLDRDLFPAIAEFLRGRQLRSLSLVAADEHVQSVVGFDASVWGVLPSLINLKSLTITYPNDLSPGLASWLIPRSVSALSFTLETVSAFARDHVLFLSQLRYGVPPNLSYIGFSELPLRNVVGIIEHGFPMVRVLRIGNNCWTVSKSNDGSLQGPGHTVELEQWPKRRVLYHTPEWLEWLGCEDALMRDPSTFSV